MLAADFTISSFLRGHIRCSSSRVSRCFHSILHSFRYVESRALIPTGRTMKRYGHEEQSKTRGAIENCLNYPFAHAHRRAGALRCVVPRYRPSSSRYCSILYNMYKFDLLAQYVQHVQHVQYGRNILFNIVHEYLAYCTICN